MKFSLITIGAIGMLALTGCKTPTKTISFDSSPRGARVFLTGGINEGSAKGSDRNFLGTTPFQWTTEVNGDNTFRMPQSGIPFYSNFVQPVFIFTAEPPDDRTNLFTKQEIFHGAAAFQAASKVPEGIFFDLNKP